MPQDNRSAMRKTIVARIATFDTSIKNPTPEQIAETIRLLDLAIEVFDGQPDGEVLKKMKAELEKSNKDINSPVSQSPTQTPSGNIPPETEVPELNVPAQEPVAPNGATEGESAANSPEEVQSAMGGGDVSQSLNVSEARFVPTGPRVDSDEEAIGYTIAMLKENEGFKPKAYWDKTGKVWTVGHGLTEYPDGRKVGPRDVVTEEQSVQHMRDYVTKKLIPMASKNVPNWATMDPRLKAAMLDTGYNAGPGYFGSKSPRMMKRLGSGEDPAKVLAEENATWNKSGGVVVKGLENRRQRVKERLIDWYSRDASKSV